MTRRSRTPAGLPDGDLAGRVVVVTGAGRGVGAATARQLTEAGAHVALLDRDGASAKETAAALTGRTVAIEVDLTDRAAYAEALDAVEGDLGPIDALVSNAGIMPLARLEDETHASTDAQIAVNLTAVITGCHDVARRLLARGAAGHLVNVSSGLGRTPMAGAATYVATKHAVSGFSNSLALQFRIDGRPIAVTAVHPSVVDTTMARGLGTVKGARTITPDEVAAAIVETLRSPRDNVYVPASLGPTIRYGSLLPQRLGEALARALGSERLTLDALGHPDRAAYEAEAVAASPPDQPDSTDTTAPQEAS